MYFTYILRSERSGKYYTGSCADVAIRLARHNAGKVRSTMHDAPWQLEHLEEHPDRQSAYRRERQIKSYKGGAAFKRLLKKE